MVYHSEINHTRMKCALDIIVFSNVAVLLAIASHHELYVRPWS